MLFPSCQTIQIKWIDELAYIVSFVLLTIVNKVELAEKWGFSPTSYQGWQTLFSLTVFLCLLAHPRIRSEVKILDRTSLILLLPVSISYAVAIATGTVALSFLSVPIFLAWSNACPAVLGLFTRKTLTYGSSALLGCLAVCLSIIIIFFIDSTEANRQFYLFLFVHVIISLFQSVYLKKVNLQILDFTRIFYNNSVSLVILLPVSILNLEQVSLNFSYLFPTFVTGFLCLTVQIFMFRIKAKNTNFLIVQGIAQFLTILMSIYLFENGLDLWLWCLIGINWFTTSFILNLHNEDANKNSQFILVVPNVSKNLYVEKYINYNDMA